MLLFLVFGACTNLDTESILKKAWNQSSSGTSEFDGTKNIQVNNIPCTEVVMELYQDTYKAKKGIVLLKAGIRSIENIGNNNSLLFNLDGKIYTFKTDDVVTEHDSVYARFGANSVNVPFSNKKYIIPESFIRKVTSSKTVLVKLYLLNDSFIEGKCSKFILADFKKYGLTQKSVDITNRSALGVHGFQKFVKMMDNTNW